MKTKEYGKRQTSRDTLVKEYRFDYSKAKPNRFAPRLGADRIAVVLDPDVSMIYRTPAAVNMALREIIAARSLSAKGAARVATSSAAKKITLASAVSGVRTALKAGTRGAGRQSHGLPYKVQKKATGELAGDR